MNRVVVIGSINMDLVTVCEQAPKGGETLFGTKFLQISGGKGANQAVAIGKLGSCVTMLGKVVKDSFGEDLIKSMKKNNVNTDYIEKCDLPTGTANIVVEGNGQNRILVVPGANSLVDVEYIERNLDVIKDADIVVTQLEIPVETVEYTLKKAKEFGKITILNPAPARKLSQEIIANSDFIIPNESELNVITGIETETEEGIKKAGDKLLKSGVKTLIVTLGSKGSLHLDEKNMEFHSAYKVKAIDTTAAGDSFIGGFVRTLKENNIGEAIEFATKVSAIAVTKEGAQSSIPSIEEVENFVAEKRK